MSTINIAELSEEQLKRRERLLNNPNGFMPNVIEKEIGVTVSLQELKDHGLTGTTLTIIEQRVQSRLGRMTEESDWNICQTMEDYQNFIRNHPTSVHVAEAQTKIDNFKALKKSSDFAAAMSGEATLEMMEQFIMNYSGTEEAKRVSESFEKRKIEEAKRREAERLEAERQEAMFDDMAFNNAKNQHSIPMMEEYIARYTRHLEEARILVEKWRIEPIVREAIQKVLDKDDVMASEIIELCYKYSSYKEQLKRWMLEDMAVHPNRYHREDIHKMLFTSDEIMPLFHSRELEGIIESDMLHYIKMHRDTKMDSPGISNLPVEDNFESVEGTTDVYFFGVPGSGKTSVLSGLLSVNKMGKSGGSDYYFKYLSHGVKHCGFNYASILNSAIENNVFPPRTLITYSKDLSPLNQHAKQENSSYPDDFSFNQDIPSDLDDDISRSSDNTSTKKKYEDDKFIQIIDCEIEEKRKDKTYSHKISFIEMPGERTLSFAGSNEKDMEKLGEGTKELFMNKNPKVMFFVIDPKDAKSYDVNINNNNAHLTQAQAITAVADFLLTMPEVLENVVAVHIVVAKADTLNKAQKSDLVEKFIDATSYQKLSDSLKKMCGQHLGRVNVQCDRKPYVFTFSLGDIRPGDMVVYNKRDSINLLKLIAANTISISQPDFWDNLKIWFNQ